VIDQRLSKLAQRLDQAFSLRWIAKVNREDNHHPLALVFCGKWGCFGTAQNCERAGHVLGAVAMNSRQARKALEAIAAGLHRRTKHDRRADRMQLKHERSNDPEVPAAAAKRPNRSALTVELAVTS